MKALKMRESTMEELQKKVQDLRTELKNLRFQRAKGELKNLLKIKDIRHDIARALTVIKEKKGEGKK
ncbi:MAG TPA: 50S ribosomal protein L29 [Candidatus Omnitrophota bacterium]|nr:50S ribosomal protein L29 [Candidatus Omnitrophota bacterium]